MKLEKIYDLFIFFLLLIFDNQTLASSLIKFVLDYFSSYLKYKSNLEREFDGEIEH